MMNEDQSLRGRFCWTQEELARNLRQMGWPNIWKNARRFKARLPYFQTLGHSRSFARRAFCP